MNFLEEEAGICAYTNAGRSIDFVKVKPVYRTVEYEADDYIIGSVPIPGYPETEDVHVFISKDGWVAAYYPADEPISKMIDWKSYQGNEITSTKLELALKEVANATNFPIVDVKYYDFVCPQANKLLLVVDREKGDNVIDSFDIMIPNEIIIYERSWGLCGYSAYGSLHIDDNKISEVKSSSRNWEISYGKLTPDQLKQGLFHNVRIKNDEWNGTGGWAAAGIILAYQQLQ